MLGLLLYSLNMLICALIVFVCFFATEFIYAMPRYWAAINLAILHLTTKTQLELDLPEGLRLDKSYLVIANHQSWADIIVLFDVFSGRIPMLKFFMKQQLKWVPFVGQVCWLYGFPFLYRQGTSRKKDMESTRKACERFKKRPGSLMIFAEGTRFTKEKQLKQQSPFQHLLKPKAGGMAMALEYMGDQIKSIIDVTIIYENGQCGFLDFCRGKIKKITVKAREIPITPDLQSDYQGFLNDVWAEKDKLL